jgi:hypothetical protein
MNMIYHNYSYSLEELLLTNHWKERVGENAKHESRGVLFSAVGRSA